MHKLLQTSWTAIFGAMSMIEGLVLAWWAEKIYKIWSRLFARVASIQWPWQPKAEVEADADVEVDVEVQPKRVSRPRQAAIDARNE